MPTLRIGSNQCQCDSCGEFFGGVRTFDLHRVFMDKDSKGKYIENWDRRRCLTPAEMEAKGWRKNKHGFWGRDYSTTKRGEAA